MPRRDDRPEFPAGALVHIIKMSSTASYCDVGIIMPTSYNAKKIAQEMGATHHVRVGYNYVDVMMMKKSGGVEIATVPKEWLMLIDDPEPGT